MKLGDFYFVVTLVDARSIVYMTVSVVLWISPSTDYLSAPTLVLCPA